MDSLPSLVLWVVAAEAVASDGFAWSKGDSRFFCGNFGLMLLDSLAAPLVKEILSTMLRVTMMRGAQSAGLVTYERSSQGHVGMRKRVCNGKRTDLCKLLMAKFDAQVKPTAISAPALFQGHTRFATSSIANLGGCHPHQWLPARRVVEWKRDPASSRYVSRGCNHECYITHNGDLDFFELHGTVYPLGDIFALLEAFLHRAKPAPVDSAGVAGLLDLLRTKGMWGASVRYGYVFGGLEKAGNLANQISRLWSAETLGAVTAAFEGAWERVLRAPTGGERAVIDPEKGCGDAGSDAALREAMVAEMLELVEQSKLDLKLPPSVKPDDRAAAAEALIRCAVGAFFEQDLLAAGQQLLARSEGSFGLVLSSALDAANELVVAARGQTMSVAFFPRLGLFTFGSESSATKAGLGKSPTTGDSCDAANATVLDAGFLDGFRFDLDDVNGEVMLLRWSDSPSMDASKHGDNGGVETGSAEDLAAVAPHHSPKKKSYAAAVMRFGQDGAQTLRAYSFIDGHHGSKLPLLKRVLRLGGNPFVQPLPPMGLRDPVGDDIAAIPSVVRKIQADWNEPCESLNRLTAFTLLSKLKKRLLQYERGEHDGSVDLLVTGCEVSLWIGEQFASDMHNAFPKLKIVTLSANKLLAQLGQAFPVPNTGFYFNETSYNFCDSCVLMLSHSGGTFATLNVSNLLKGFTANLFVVTSEWDTQIARSVRAGRPGQVGGKFQLNSYVFTTFCGCRPAEPVSLTAVATHQLLTQVLLYLMYAIRYHEGGKHPTLGGSTFTIQEVQELEGLNLDGAAVLEALTSGDGACRAGLLRQGRYWAQHILEGPVAWILSAIYIVVTVTLGATPLSAIVYAIFGAAASDENAPCSPVALFPEGTNATDELQALLSTVSFACPQVAEPGGWRHAVGFVDAFIYIFLPWWMTVLLRLVQRRPWLHRVAGRSLLIGDIPWVSQSLEAYVSKLFALSYSVAGLAVSSGNPCDHLVHRHTHRVVRGALLAVGRPDGRLNALTSAENTICLSVNQASSIQNFGVTCESITVGHNPFKLDLTANALFIPPMRRAFMSEYVLEQEQAKRGIATSAGSALSASALMSILSTAELDTFEGLPKATRNEERPDFIKKIEPLWGKGSLYEERFIGAWMAQEPEYMGCSPAELMEKQGQLQELYEGRIASMQRFVAFLVMFHEMARSVQDFWPRVSCGLLGYDMSRSQSIMRIATTASPVSGSDVRHKMLELAEHTAKLFCANVLQANYLKKRMRKRTKEMMDAQVEAMKAMHFGSDAQRAHTWTCEERTEFKEAMDWSPVKEKTPSVRGLNRRASKEDVAALMAPAATEARPASLANGAIQKAFAKYDRDGTGTIEVKELRGCLRSLGVLVDEAEGDEVLAKYDADANHVLTINEFELMVRELEALRATYTTQEKKARQSSVASMPAPDSSDNKREGAPEAASCTATGSSSDVSEASQATQEALAHEAMDPLEA